MDNVAFHTDGQKEDLSHPEVARHRRWIAFLAYFGIPMILWTVAIAVSLWFAVHTATNYAVDAARIQARSAFEKDVMYRRWNSQMGGVYVPISDKTPPNPYLAHDPHRDFTSPFGVSMTKVNPAYMTRLVHELGRMDSGVISHITSNNPIRPENRPDAWESAALQKLERFETTEISDLEEMDGKLYLRLIGPLVTETSCLLCHSFQGYQTGDIRGGISISVPLAPLMASANATLYTLTGSHAVLWTLGILAIGLTSRRLRRYIRERDLSMRRLQHLTEDLEQRVLERTQMLHQRQQQLRSFMNNTNAGTFLKDASGVYLQVNPKFAALSGRTIESMIGRKDDEWLDPEQAARFRATEETVMRTRLPQEEENVFPFSDEREVYNSFVFPIFQDHKQDVVSGIGGIVVNVTQHKAMEKALLTEKKIADSANQAKSDFLANVSHEIRTPLNGIIGMTDLLSRSQLPENAASMVETIKSSGDVLLSLINDMLDFSKIEAGKMHLEVLPFNLTDLIFNTARGLTSIAYQKRIDLNVRIGPGLPPQLVGDATRIRQIISNLMGNAIKFTEIGEVTISAEMLQQNRNKTVTIRISIMDTGTGIPEDRQKSIFDAFEQSDASISRKYGGTGLGLPISQRLAEMMGSEIHLESQVGSGSTFSFNLTLPVAKTTESEPAEDRADGARLNAYGALVVDDNMTSRMILTEYLNSWGMTVHQAENADEALECLKTHENAIDMVITDLQMPGKDGRLLANTIPTIRKSLPVIILLSGHLAETDSQDHQQVAHLEKPVRPDALLGLIRRLLNIDKASRTASSVADDGDISGASRNPLRILLVDDVDINQGVASAMLEKMGHTTTIANNGQEALDVLKKEEFDLIFMDIQMPVMDGVAATRIIREEEALTGAHIPIVAMTANAMKGDEENYLQKGMDGYISKPLKFDDLVNVIDKISNREE